MNTLRSTRLIFGLLLGLCGGALSAAELRVPAFTAYTLPDAEGTRISQRTGVARWTDPALSVNWYGQFKQAGEISARVMLRLPAGVESKLKLTVEGQSREVAVQGGGNEGGACPAPTGTGNEGGACPAPTGTGNEGGACPAPTALSWTFLIAFSSAPSAPG